MLAQIDPMVILSLSTDRGQVRFHVIFLVGIQLDHEQILFQFKLYGIRFKEFVFSPSAQVLKAVLLGPASVSSASSVGLAVHSESLNNHTSGYVQLSSQ